MSFILKSLLTPGRKSIERKRLPGSNGRVGYTKNLLRNVRVQYNEEISSRNVYNERATIYRNE